MKYMVISTKETLINCLCGRIVTLRGACNLNSSAFDGIDRSIDVWLKTSRKTTGVPAAPEGKKEEVEEAAVS